MLKLAIYFPRATLYIIGEYVSRQERHNFFISIDASYLGLLFLGSFKCKCGPVFIKHPAVKHVLKHVLKNVEEKNTVIKHAVQDEIDNNIKPSFQQLPYDNYEYQKRKNTKPRRRPRQGRKKRTTCGEIERREYEETNYINTDLCFLSTFQEVMWTFEDYESEYAMLESSEEENVEPDEDWFAPSENDDSDEYYNDYDSDFEDMWYLSNRMFFHN